MAGPQLCAVAGGGEGQLCRSCAAQTSFCEPSHCARHRARAAPTPPRQLLTAPSSTWRTSTARDGPVGSLHSPSLAGWVGWVSAGRGQSALCDFTSGAAAACFAVERPGIALSGRVGLEQCKVGRRRCKEGSEGGGSLAQPRSCFLPAPRLPKLQSAPHCKATSDSNTHTNMNLNTEANTDANTDANTCPLGD